MSTFPIGRTGTLILKVNRDVRLPVRIESIWDEETVTVQIVGATETPGGTNSFTQDDWDFVPDPKPLPTDYGLYQPRSKAGIEHEVTLRHVASRGWLNAINNEPAEVLAQALHDSSGLVRLVREGE